MPIIIDGNNLIGASPDLELEDPTARSRLISIVRSYQERKRNKIILVFDGKPEHGLLTQQITEKLTIIYPRMDATADDEIKRVFANYNDYRNVILVSSDRELKKYAKQKGAKTINSIEFFYTLKRFLRQSGKKEETQKRINIELSDGEIDQWMKIFNKE